MKSTLEQISMQILHPKNCYCDFHVLPRASIQVSTSLVPYIHSAAQTVLLVQPLPPMLDDSRDTTKIPTVPFLYQALSRFCRISFMPAMNRRHGLCPTRLSSFRSLLSKLWDRPQQYLELRCYSSDRLSLGTLFKVLILEKSAD